jgi:hypothetical protein
MILAQSGGEVHKQRHVNEDIGALSGTARLERSSIELQPCRGVK